MAGEIKADDPAEQQLVLALDAFGRAVATSAEKYSPHILCDHIYKVAQAFSRFYTDCPILVDDTPEDIKASRLALADVTLRQLEKGCLLRHMLRLSLNGCLRLHWLCLTRGWRRGHVHRGLRRRNL